MPKRDQEKDLELDKKIEALRRKNEALMKRYKVRGERMQVEQCSVFTFELPDWLVASVDLHLGSGGGQEKGRRGRDGAAEPQGQS